MVKKLPVTSDQRGSSDTALRAIAILAVVTIHFLAGLHASVYRTDWFQPFVVFLDQLCRISVPMFVALSGFGLMQKYLKKEFSWLEFLQRRVFKLLPLYIGWSLMTALIFALLPTLRPLDVPDSLVTQLLFGKADYHLYFVPMIFQLYLLFPFLMIFVKKFWKLSLLFTGVFQVALYMFYTARPQTFSLTIPFATDQQQYPWFFTWIFYFVLGMCLPFIHKKMGNILFSLFAFGGTALGLFWAVSAGLSGISHGIDPIIALRFTRLPVLFYTSFAIVWLTWITKNLRHLPQPFKIVGERSYWIYLVHTMLLRAYFLLISANIMP